MLAEQAKKLYFSLRPLQLHESHFDIYWGAIKEATSTAEVKRLKASHPKETPLQILLSEAMQDRVAPDDEVLADYLKTYHHDKLWVEALPGKIEKELFSMPLKLEDGREGIELTTPMNFSHGDTNFEVLFYAVEPAPEQSHSPS